MNYQDVIKLMKDSAYKEAQVLLEAVSLIDESMIAALQLIDGCKGHVLVTGVGTSHFLAARFAHLLCCSGVPALFIHPADSLHGTSGAVKTEDVLIAISKGGVTDEIVSFAKIAKNRGAKIIAMTEAPGSILGTLSDAVIRVQVPPDSDPFGMVATASSLANGLISDAFCAGLLRLKGQTVESFGSLHPGGAVGKKLAGIGESLNTQEGGSV